MRAPGQRGQRERGQHQPAEAARRRHPDERLQVEQHQHQARAGLGAGEGARVRIHPRLHEHRGPRQHEHQQQRENGLQGTAVVEAGGVGGMPGPHQEQRQVQHRHLTQRVQAGVGHQVMGEARNVDHEDQVEEQLQPGSGALLFRGGTGNGRGGQRIRQCCDRRACEDGSRQGISSSPRAQNCWPPSWSASFRSPCAAGRGMVTLMPRAASTW